MDFILNGQGFGNVAAALTGTNFNVNCLRPFVGSDGRSYITVNQDDKMVAVPTMNANATLRKDEWIQIDQAVVKAAKSRLTLVQDLRSSGLTFNIGNGLGKTILETQTQSDVKGAAVSMDAMSEDESDRPEYGLNGLPLPIVHAGFTIGLRELNVSRNGGSPLDTSLIELKARKVAETIDSLALGTYGSYKFGGYDLYGLTNFPSRITKVITAPTATGWTPEKLVTEVLDMRQKSVNKFHFGPWKLYFSTAWDQYLDRDYSSAKGDNTLRERLAKIQGITSISSLDTLTGFQVLLVQQTSDVVREVIGMEITTLQWETHGGLQQHFKIMGIMVPQVRADHNGNTGIVHGASA